MTWYVAVLLSLRQDHANGPFLEHAAVCVHWTGEIIHLNVCLCTGIGREFHLSFAMNIEDCFIYALESPYTDTASLLTLSGSSPNFSSISVVCSLDADALMHTGQFPLEQLCVSM